MIRHITVLFLAVTAYVSASTFDWTKANLTLNHAQNSYCDPASYTTRENKNVLAGFVTTYAIYDSDHDTNGYVGYHEGQQTIYVSFRGSESIQNWLDNLDAILTDYPKGDDCEVHKGFYSAEQSCFPDVLAEVQNLKGKYPSYGVMVTGHSLGAALATFTALDLLDSGISNVEMWNYGSPRVGNTNFANYVNTVLPNRARITHHKDMVPHVPMHERFTHYANEWYQPDDNLNVNECFGNEDKDCSYQWHATSISDHLYYLGVHLGQGSEECEYFLN